MGEIECVFGDDCICKKHAFVCEEVEVIIKKWNMLHQQGLIKLFLNP